MKQHRSSGGSQSDTSASQMQTQTGPMLEQAQGNEAAAQQVGAETDPQALLSEHTEGAAITVGGTLPGNLVLGEVDGNQFKTDEKSNVTVGVARWGAWITLSPPLHIRPGSFLERAATGGITVSRIQFSFANGKASVHLDTGRMGNLLDWGFDLEDKISSTFESAIEGAMPADLVGFDPYTDPDIQGRLQKIVSSFSSSLGSTGGGAAGELAAQIEDPTVGISASPKIGEWELGEGLKLKVGERANVQLKAAMAGNLDEAMASPRVERLTLTASDMTIEHKTAGALAAIGIRSAVINPDMSIERFDYDLSTEGLAGGLKALALLLQLRTGQDLGVRDTNTPRLEALREIIDDKVHSKVPDILREQIEANRGAIPGFDLGQVLPGSTQG